MNKPNQVARITEFENGISAIDTDYMRPLFDASHLIIQNDHAAFVDTGVNHNTAWLLDALARKDIDAAAVECVLLTHVHLDHAGGAGALMQHLPNAKAVIHPRGAAHMIDPAKLIQGAKSVYAAERFDKAYGDPMPIEARRILVLQGRPLQCIFTEGHARHHYCLSDPASKGVFTGDSFGVSYRELDTAAGESVFPTTTPIHFNPAERQLTG